MLEKKIQKNFRAMMEGHGWYTKPTVGFALQAGFPDVWCAHPDFDYRWVDCKRPGKYEFTKAQIVEWPIWEAFGTGIWIITGYSQADYKTLFQPPNWKNFWKPKYGEIPTKQEIMERLARELKVEAVEQIFQDPIEELLG